MAEAAKGKEASGKDTKKTERGDQPVLSHIEKLVEEEHHLFQHGATTDQDHARLAKIQVELDQAWDLLRQRRAKREFGGNPQDAHERPPKIVENYEG